MLGVSGYVDVVGIDTYDDAEKAFTPMARVVRLDSVMSVRTIRCEA